MSETKRKNFTGEFKAKVALEAIRGIKTVNEIGQEFGIHPTQVGLWKKELQAQSDVVSLRDVYINGTEMKLLPAHNSAALCCRTNNMPRAGGGPSFLSAVAVVGR